MQIAYVNVFVKELGPAVEFYRNRLGLALEFADEEHGYASFATEAIRLGVAVAGADQGDLIGRHSGIGITTPDLASEHARLVERGVRFTSPPARQPWGGFMATFSDPDGNVFYLDEVTAVHPGE